MAGGETNSKKQMPLVSIITPFYNTEFYITECIESVLAQTYSNWEYILVNNQSTDASQTIAERYAKADSRIRLFDTPKFFSQVENFNAAFGYISPESRYCKFVLADDWLFPDCVERMVACAEANPSAGIVSSYRLYGEEIIGDGLPYSTDPIPGRKACQHMLRDGYYLTGSPTATLVRSEIVRKIRPFFPEGWLYDDLEATFRVLADYDLGFVHQVLTFSRRENESLTSSVLRFGPGPLRKYMFAVQYGPQFFSGEEYARYFQREKDFYGEFLAGSVFQFKGKEFWDFHRRGLRLVGANFRSVGLPKYVFLEVLDILFNPKKTVGRVLRLLKKQEEKPEKVTARVSPEVGEQPKGT